MTRQENTAFEMAAHFEMALCRGYDPQCVGKTRLALNIAHPESGKLIWTKAQLRNLTVAGY